MYGENFYGLHTAQYQLQWSKNKSVLLKIENLKITV